MKPSDNGPRLTTTKVIDRLRSVSLVAIIAAAMPIAQVTAYAADSQPIEKKIDAVEQKIDDAHIMGRVQLVGVIADHSAADAGIALIKDIQTGRTYAIKTGDNLPGVPHIVLNKVRRELAVFHTESKDYHVRLSFATDSSSSNSNVNDINSSGDPSGVVKDGPGLFETWAAGAPQKSADAVATDILNKIHPKNDNSSKEEEKTALPRRDASEINESRHILEDDVIEE